MNDSDIKYLQRALDLAKRGLGCTSPNPVVGAVIVRDGQVLGEGWHAGAGLDHAEVAAIRDALVRANVLEEHGSGPLDGGVTRQVCSGATMYVSLEPCCTHGRTPPCTSALIAAGFVRVVAAAIDPTPSVNGEGMQALTQAGIEVGLAEGDVERRARRQNEGLRKVHTLGLPFVLYKYAMTLDGRIAVDSGDSRWVSSPESRALVHRWRAGFDAVVVGSGTLRSDDPRLTARGRSCSRQPLRVVVDSECGLGADSSLVRTANEGPVLVVCGEGVTPERRSEVRSWGVDTAVVKRATDGGLEPEAVCRELAARGVQYALLEGGPRLAGSWWAAGMIDKVAAFVSPRIASGIEGKTPFFGPGVESMERAATLTEVRTRAVGCDVLVTGYRGEPY